MYFGRVFSISGLLLGLALPGLNLNFTSQKFSPLYMTNSNNCKASAQRVVALTSLAADIVFRLDANKLVGRPGSRLLNQDEKLAQIPTVNQGQMPPDITKIISLKPDLVVGVPGIHSPIAKQLEQQGICVSLSKVDSWENLEKYTKVLAELVNAEPQLLLTHYKTILGQKLTNSPKTLVLVARDPILAPNKNSWAGDVLDQLNINSLTSQMPNSSPRKGFSSLNEGEIIQSDPDVIIVIDTEIDKLLEYYKSQPFWNQLRAVQNNQVYVFDYYGFIIPGSIEAIEQTVTKLKHTLLSTTDKPRTYQKSGL